MTSEPPVTKQIDAPADAVWSLVSDVFGSKTRRMVEREGDTFAQLAGR